MCLTTKDPTIKVAEEDIICYKGTDHSAFYDQDNEYRSSVRGFVYNKGKKNPVVTLNPYTRTFSQITTVDEGYHSFNSLEDITDPNKAIFVIPKGANYIDGWYNEDPNRPNRVSNTIIYMGRLKRC